MERCNNCQRNFNTSALYEAVREDESVARHCQGCLDTLFFCSAHNGLYYPRSQRVSSPEGWVTQEQLDAAGWQCDHCTETFPDSEDYNSVINDCEESITVCHECSSYYSWCESCDEYALENDFVNVRHAGIDRVCGNCANDDERYGNLCDNCGMHCHDTQYNEDIGEHYCDRHTPVNSAIRSWNYRPSFDYQKMSYESSAYEPYLGVELEVGTDEANTVADEIHSAMGDNLYFKSDASCDGFEIVTQPMTLEYHKRHEDWREKLKTIKAAGANSYESGQCGIHVHVSSNVLKPKDWWKVLNFIYSCKTRIKIFCQRAGNYQYCSYVSPENYGSSVHSMPMHNNRYTALNFTNYGTVEFRMFRGTLDQERFWASLEFAHSMVSFARNHGFAFFDRADKDEMWQAYLDHLKSENRYGTILKHFSKRGLAPDRNIMTNTETGQTYIAISQEPDSPPVVSAIDPSTLNLTTAIAGTEFNLEL